MSLQSSAKWSRHSYEVGYHKILPASFKNNKTDHSSLLFSVVKTSALEIPYGKGKEDKVNFTQIDESVLALFSKDCSLKRNIN